MNNSNQAYLSLSIQLNQFIDKHYRLIAIKGLLLVGLISIGVVFGVILLERFFHFTSLGRSVLFFGSVAILLYALIFHFILPLGKSFRWLSRMGFREAAGLVSHQLPEVTDQLLNAIELEKASKNKQSDLVHASITQKSNKVLHFNLLSSLSFKEHKKYLIGFIFVFGLAFICSITFPSFVSAPFLRVVQFQKSFVPPNPFVFQINNNQPLVVLEDESLKIKIKAVGKTDPQRLIIYSNNQRFFTLKDSSFYFNYEFKNIQESFFFQLKDGRGDLIKYDVKVLPKAKLLVENKVAVYPSYTQLENDTFNDLSSLALPIGTTLYWDIRVKNTSNCEVIFKDTSFTFNKPKERCVFYYQPKESQDYKITVKNELSPFLDSLNYRIDVEKDQYPSISFEEFTDSSDTDSKFFFGKINDDYGFSKLSFNYSSDLNEEKKEIAIAFQPNNQSPFSFDFNFKRLKPSPGEKITYYFSVYDNDGFNGPKKTSSIQKILIVPDKEKIKKEREGLQLAQKNALDNLQTKISSFDKDLKNIKSDLLNKKKMDWQDKSNIENFLQKQQQIQLDLEKLQQQMNKKLSFDLDEKNKEILEKQEMLSKMMDELMTDEMKKLYDELNELVNQMNKDKVLDKIEDIDLSQENLMKELDRTIEHFKRLEIEKKAEEISKELEELANKQDSLKKQTKSKGLSSFEKTKKQEKIKSDFYDIKNEIFDLKKKNNELASPKDINTEEEEESIKKAMDDALNQLSNNKEKKASESQQKSSDKIKDLAKKMNSLSQKNSQQEQEDMATLRLLLEQLVTFSLQQEGIMSDLKKTNPQDPKYISIGQEQRKLKDKISIIDDSLTALAKRQIMISKKINSEVQLVKRNLTKSIKTLTERKKRDAGLHQQTVMMHTNELGLLLSEIMKQMQQNMPGNGQCNKPGGKSKKPGNSLPQNAEQMKKQIDAMKKFMEGQKSGKQPGKEGSPFEQLGRMAAEQAAIKKQLREMAQEMNKDGSGKGNGLNKIIKEIEEIENQIINNELSLSSVMRQEEIKIKLLELERATKEQEKEKKREATEATDKFKKSNSELYDDYLRIKKNEIELLKSIPPNLKPYYKNKVNEYFKNVEGL